MKKILLMFFFITTLCLPIHTFADTNIKVMLNNQYMTFETAPFIENERTLIPLRAIAEALNIKIDWDAKTKTVIATKEDRIIELKIGNTNAVINGMKIGLDAPAQIIKDRTFVPLRFLSESLGANVQWYANSNTIIITSTTVNPDLIMTESANIHMIDAGNTEYGDWTSDIAALPIKWQSGAQLQFQTTLRISDAHLEKLAEKKIKTDGFVMLVTAERTFDAGGVIRLASDEKMSTLFTATGLPIEGGVQGAVTKRYGYGFRTPVDELVTVPLSATEKTTDGCLITFNISTKLPDDLPPGLYRLRFDYGVTANKKLSNLNGQAFAQRGFPKGPCDSESYSPPIQASAKHVNGQMVDASTIRPRIPWVLLGNYNSNGYRGMVAEEDKPNFGLSARNIIQDDVILPLYDENNTKNKLSYNLEPQFPTDLIDDRQNIPWDYTKGILSIQVTSPDGITTDLGSSPFIAKAGQFPTTKNTKFTQWKPQMYGEYIVKATGWIADTYGNRYDGGGTYKFWIAKRMTLATATFQGQSYPVGNRYGRDIGFSPAVPADVEVTASLYVNSDPKNVKTVSYSGKASLSGVFGAAQGMKPLMFDAPGEYSAKVLAKYTDADGHLWVESMRHTGVIYPQDTSIVAHGKMVQVGKNLVERGDTNLEGWSDPQTGETKLEHINFPYNSGDVLLIASEGQGANKIEPVMSWATKDNPAPYDPKIQGIGLTNVRIQTSNGYSPHLFPEYITDWMYYYASAPRPGFMGRFLVGENGARAPYWPTSSTNFGGQINSSSNGDAPGDIYRLLGGVVIRKKDEAPLYAGYMANAFILPKDSKDNRVIAPGSEDILGSTGQIARVFLAMNARPGMVYDVGTSFAPALQIDPMVPLNITFTLTYPDGRKVVASGIADSTGSFVGKDRWTLDVPGVYRYTIDSDWNGYKALVPGMPQEGGEMYVIEKEKPAGATGITFNLPALSKFDSAKGTKFVGNSTAKEINFAVIIPGAVLMQSTIPVIDGKFEFNFDPAALHNIAQTYDTTNTKSGKPELGDVVHLTFFSEETTPSDITYHSFVRLIIRGNTVHYAR
ncbi:MAG: copper amine oxidase N-terminal domain-containing protein [Anaerolineales bacterium]|nr:copper amine oxidase N-terminal domain-containing protein [Anaerolineales bacterium]